MQPVTSRIPFEAVRLRNKIITELLPLPSSLRQHMSALADMLTTRLKLTFPFPTRVKSVSE